jgi:hypothetical protein
VFKFYMVMGSPMVRCDVASTVCATDSQATTCGLLLILDDLFASRSCMRRIHSGTFVVDSSTKVPLLSAQGHRNIVPMSSSTQVDRNMRGLANGESVLQGK